MLTARELRDLLSLDKNLHPELEALVKNEEDDAILNLVNLNNYCATKLWGTEDFVYYFNFLLESDYIFDDASIHIPDYLNPLRKEKDIQGLAKKATNDINVKVLNECIDAEWTLIEDALRRTAATELGLGTNSYPLLYVENNPKEACLLDVLERRILTYTNKPFDLSDRPFVTLYSEEYEDKEFFAVNLNLFTKEGTLTDAVLPLTKEEKEYCQNKINELLNNGEPIFYYVGR